MSDTAALVKRIESAADLLTTRLSDDPMLRRIGEGQLTQFSDYQIAIALASAALELSMLLDDGEDAA